MAHDVTVARSYAPGLGSLAAAAWVDAILGFWRHAHAQARIAPALPLQLVDLAPQGETVWLLLNMLGECGAQALGFAPRLRYVACLPDGQAPSAWYRTPALRTWLDEGRIVIAAAGEEWLGAQASAANPVVVLAHGAWSRLPQRLFAAHYGKLLEGRLDRQRAATGNEGPGEAWHAAVLPVSGAALERVAEGYRARLNSAPFSWPEGAMRSISGLVRCLSQGGLVLAMDHGFVSEQEFRLCGFDRFAACGEHELPVNFHLLDALWREHGAEVWQRGLPGERAIQVALLDPPGTTGSGLDAVRAPLESGTFADAAALARLAMVAVKQEGDAQLLALLRHGHHDTAVFAAACPRLHDQLLARHGCDRGAWAAALERVAANHLPMPGGPRLHGSIARAAMRVAAWGLARHVLTHGMAVHGRDVDSLLLLAHCEIATGRLQQAETLASQALASCPGDARVMQLLAHLRARAADRDDVWRRCIVHPTLPLVLEPLDLDHAEALLHQYRDPQIAVMTGLPQLRTVSEMKHWIEEQLQTPDRCDHAVMHADVGLVGHVGLCMSESVALLCFWTGVDHLGQGLAAEAARLLCEFARGRGIQWIFAEAFADNHRSIRALRRAGFVHMGLDASVAGEARNFLCHALPEGSLQAAVAALNACMVRIDREPVLDPECMSSPAQEVLS